MAVSPARAALYDAAQAAFAAGIMCCAIECPQVEDCDSSADEARQYFDETYARNVGTGVADIGSGPWVLTISGG